MLRRETSWAARLRTFKIFLDDAHVEGIRDGETKRLAIPSGSHRLQLRCDWCRSPELDLDFNESHQPAYVCRTSYLSPADPILRPRHYIDLVPEGQPLPSQRTLGEDFALRAGIGIPPAVVLIVILAILNSGPAIATGLGSAWIFLALLVPIPKRKSSARAK